MNIQMNDLLYTLSLALDYVEHDITGATTHHSKRVAYLSSILGQSINLPEYRLTDLVTCALLHDCGFPEILRGYLSGEISEKDAMQRHCASGEALVQMLPFETQMEGVILYHHENADGSGAFGKMPDQTPLESQLLHFADRLDVQLNTEPYSPQTYQKALQYLEQTEGHFFAPWLKELFTDVIDPQELQKLYSGEISGLLREWLPARTLEHAENQALYNIATFFAKIIDFKSHFTSSHSLGIAQKAETMARYYGYDEETVQKLYFAGAVHDIGKLAVSGAVLEKPGKLDMEEYTHIQSHALYTYQFLSPIQGEGMDDIVRWASYHHEKLNGRGYPFGKSAEDLDHNSRLMACLDIYQALTEARPYKNGFSHDRTISVMREMVHKGELDPEITEDIHLVFHKQEAIASNEGYSFKL